MNSSPNRGPMPLRLMIVPIFVAITCFMAAALLWGSHNAAAVTLAVVGVAVLTANYYVYRQEWRDGTLSVRRR